MFSIMEEDHPPPFRRSPFLRRPEIRYRGVLRAFMVEFRSSLVVDCCLIRYWMKFIGNLRHCHFPWSLFKLQSPWLIHYHVRATKSLRQPNAVMIWSTLTEPIDICSEWIHE